MSEDEARTAVGPTAPPANAPDPDAEVARLRHQMEADARDDDGIARASYALLSILADANVLPDVDLLALQEEAPDQFLGDLLVDKRLLNESDIQALLIRSLRIPWIEANSVHVPAELTALLSESFCRRYRLVPLSKARTFLTMAVANPLDKTGIQKVEEATGLKVRLVFCSADDLPALITRAYHGNEEEQEQEEEAEVRAEEEHMSAALSEATEHFAAEEQAEEQAAEQAEEPPENETPDTVADPAEESE
jgi:hypothetical protein